jgi:recombination protein RecA
LIPKEKTRWTSQVKGSKVATADNEKAKALAGRTGPDREAVRQGHDHAAWAEGEPIEDIQVGLHRLPRPRTSRWGVGGLPRGRVDRDYGPESSGKTTLTLQVIAEMQRQTASARSSTPSTRSDIQYAQKLGVDVSDLLISQPDTGEQALEIVDSLVRSGAVDLIVIDSVAALVPKAEIEGRDGRLAARPAGPPHEPGAAQADRHDQEDQLHGHLHQPDPHEDRRDVRQPRNHHRRQRAEVLRLGRLDIRRTGTIKKGEEAIGNETKVKVVKNKVAPPFKTAEFDILFGEGISREGEIIDMGVANQVLDKSGAWYAYNGEKIGQGRDNAREFLRENPELAREIENKVREHLGIPLLPADVAEE